MARTSLLKTPDNWQDVVDDCRSTVGKGELGREPSRTFKRNILIAEHSPIRDLRFRWKWADIKSWIATHWSRHKWECFIQTQRDDRTGVPRDELPQAQRVTFKGEANAQNLIDTWRKRLCYQAHPETREYAEDFKIALHKASPEVSDVLVPNCVYRCGCPELRPKGTICFWEGFKEWCEGRGYDPCTVGIATRYELYNAYFYEINNRK